MYKRQVLLGIAHIPRVYHCCVLPFTLGGRWVKVSTGGVSLLWIGLWISSAVIPNALVAFGDNLWITVELCGLIFY